MRLTKDFYEQYATIDLAKALLGCKIVHQSSEGTTSCESVETEAYLRNDPASHTYKGKTQRNQSMFGEAGTLYVYLIYGMYYCINVVGKERGEAVLIRAAAPIEGIELMTLRRSSHQRTGLSISLKRNLLIKDLCNGPGKLAQAMGFNKMMHDGLVLFECEDVFLESYKAYQKNIIQTTRIGITQGAELPYRFLVADHPSVSAKPRIIVP
jgi:DNA-3-methyladenine glycosylase